MKPARVVVPLLAMVCLFLVAADTPPSMSEIQQDYDAQKYQDVLKKVAQVLPAANKAGSEYDRAKLFELKAESHLRLKQQQPASEAFAQAAKAGSDEKQIAADTATALLVKRSQNLKYNPKQPTTKPVAAGGKPEPIDIVDPKSRKEALQALFNDESKTVTAKAESLKKQTSLKPLMDGITQMAELRQLELAATESDATTRQIISGLGDHANQLMGTALKQMQEKVEQISTAANKTFSSQETVNGVTQIVTTKRGINSNDAAALKDVVSTCKNISSACDEFDKALQSGATAGAGGGAVSFASTKGQADQISKRAEEVLNANYDPQVQGGNNLPIVRPGQPPQPPQQPQPPRR
jgi:hypothetical protein